MAANVVLARFNQMRKDSAARGKSVPTINELEALIPPSMTCPSCGKPVAWTARELGRTSVLTIQHDVSGAIRLICGGCNSRHSALPGDSFYSLPPGHWRCSKCREVKPRDAFYRPVTAAGRTIYSRCKACRALSFAEWETANRAKRSAYQLARTTSKRPPKMRNAWFVMGAAYPTARAAGKSVRRSAATITNWCHGGADGCFVKVMPETDWQRLFQESIRP